MLKRRVFTREFKVEGDALPISVPVVVRESVSGLAHVLRARNVARNVTRKERSSCQDVEFLRGSSRSRPCRWCLGKD